MSELSLADLKLLRTIEGASRIGGRPVDDPAHDLDQLIGVDRLVRGGFAELRDGRVFITPTGVKLLRTQEESLWA